MKDLEPLNYFLGVEVSYVKNQMHLSQTKYALDLLKRTKFVDVKPIATPVPAGKKLSVHTEEPHPDLHTYRSIVGELQYLTITRPDLSYVVNQVCQFMHAPTTIHWTAVKRILRYVKLHMIIDFYINLEICISMRFQMLTTLAIMTRGIPQGVLVYIWDQTWFCGAQKKTENNFQIKHGV